jgi:hypothetical protein
MEEWTAGVVIQEFDDELEADKFADTVIDILIP